MQYCNNCGAELETGAVFCSVCGAKVESSKTSQEKKVDVNSVVDKMKDAIGEKRTGALILKVLGAVAAVMVVLAVVLSITGNGKSAIDVGQYTVVQTEGYDGFGTVTVQIDKESMTDDIKTNYKKISSSSVVQFVDDFEVVASENGNLSNGQEITLKLKYDTNFAEEHKIRFKKEEWKYTIGENSFQGLTEVDPFSEDALEINYSGTAPFVRFTLNAKSVGSDVGALQYEASPSENDGYVNIGDKITVKCTSDPEWLMQYGYKLSETEHTYTLEEGVVDKYVTDPSEFDEDSLNRMKTAAEDVINAKLATYNSEYPYVSVSNLTYLGAVSLTRKDYAENKVYLVYSVDYASGVDSSVKYPAFGEPKDFEARTMYIPVEFSEVIRYCAGDKIDYSSIDSFLHESGVWYKYGALLYGYEDNASMFTEIVRQKADQYNYVMDEKLEELF